MIGGNPQKPPRPSIKPIRLSAPGRPPLSHIRPNPPMNPRPSLRPQGGRGSNTGSRSSGQNASLAGNVRRGIETFLPAARNVRRGIENFLPAIGNIRRGIEALTTIPKGKARSKGWDTRRERYGRSGRKS